MAKSSGQTFAKRQREIARREKRQRKAERLRERRALRLESQNATTPPPQGEGEVEVVP